VIEITDDMCRRAIKAMEPDRIQGFSYGPKSTAPHVVRDVYLAYGKQVLWRGLDHDEMMERCAIERMRLALTAALSTNGT
jgi:hypothetical protein